MRESGDRLSDDGSIFDGFDYRLQVWVERGVCCDVGAGRRYAGQRVADVPGHEVRTVTPQTLTWARA